MPNSYQHSAAKCPFSCKEDLPKNWVDSYSVAIYVFWGWENIGNQIGGQVEARSHRKTFQREPPRLNLTSNLLSPIKHINSYWVRVCKKPTSSWRSSLKNVDERNNSQHYWANNVGSCCARVGRSIQTEATTPNNADRTTCKLAQQDINTTHRAGLFFSPFLWIISTA